MLHTQYVLVYKNTCILIINFTPPKDESLLRHWPYSFRGEFLLNSPSMAIFESPSRMIEWNPRSLASCRAFFVAKTSTAATENGIWKLSAINAHTLSSASRIMTPTLARWSSLNTALSKLTLSFDNGWGFHVGRETEWDISSGGRGWLARINADLAFCTSSCTWCTGTCVPLVLIVFRLFHIA